MQSDHRNADSVYFFVLTQKSNKKSQAVSKRTVNVITHSSYETALEHPAIRRA